MTGIAANLARLQAAKTAAFERALACEPTASQLRDAKAVFGSTQALCTSMLAAGSPIASNAGLRVGRASFDDFGLHLDADNPNQLQAAVNDAKNMATAAFLHAQNKLKLGDDVVGAQCAAWDAICKV